MVEEKEQDGKQNESEKERKEQQAVPVMMAPYGYPEDDEIDLSQLAAVLFHRRRLIIGITLTALLLALLASFLVASKYQYSSLVEVGQLIDTNNNYRSIESAEAVSNRYKSLSRSVALHLEQEKDVSDLCFSVENDFTVKTPEKGTIFTLTVEAPEQCLAIPFLNELNQKLINDHDRIFNQAKLKIKNGIERQQLAKDNLDTQINNLQNKISELKRQYDEKEINLNNEIEREKLAIGNLNTQIDNLNNKIANLKRQYADKLKSKENAIQELDNKIENILSQKDFLKEKIALMEQEKEDLKTRIAETTERYDKLLESKLAASESSGTGEAVGLMLFSSEVQNVQRYLSQLRQRLLLAIPEEIGQLQTRLKELDNEISEIKAQKSLEEQRKMQLEPELLEKIDELRGEIKATESEKQEKSIKIEELQNSLKQLKPELQEKIDELEGQIKTTVSQKQENAIEIRGLQNKLDNMITTQVLMPPVQSKGPVAPNRKLFVALGVILGVFIGIFAAFLVEFWKNNREKIVG